MITGTVYMVTLRKWGTADQDRGIPILADTMTQAISAADDLARGENVIAAVVIVEKVYVSDWIATKLRDGEQ